MDLLILNICETSVTTFLAHSWKDWQDCVNRAELDRGFPLEHWLDCLWNLLDLRRCCWFLWLKLGTVTPREARGVLPGAAHGSLSAFVLKGLGSILPASTAFWQCHTVFLLRFSQIVFFFLLLLVSWFPTGYLHALQSVESAITSHTEVWQRSLRETMPGCIGKV